MIFPLVQNRIAITTCVINYTTRIILLLILTIQCPSSQSPSPTCVMFQMTHSLQCKVEWYVSQCTGNTEIVCSVTRMEHFVFVCTTLAAGLFWLLMWKKKLAKPWHFLKAMDLLCSEMCYHWRNVQTLARYYVSIESKDIVAMKINIWGWHTLCCICARTYLSEARWVTGFAKGTLTFVVSYCTMCAFSEGHHPNVTHMYGNASQLIVLQVCFCMHWLAVPQTSIKLPWQ